MKTSIHIDQFIVKRFFLQNKTYIIPGGIILVCIILVFVVLLPQLQTILSERQETQKAEERVKALENNISLLNSLPNATLDDHVQLSLKAVPKDKDFAAILYTIKRISTKTRVPIGDFTFEVGDLSTKSATPKTRMVLPMHLFMQTSDFSKINEFVKELSTSLPLSEIQQLSMSQGGTTALINFYYRPITSLRVEYTTPFSAFVGTKQNTLDKISSWDSASTKEESGPFIVPSPTVSIVPSENKTASPTAKPIVSSTPAPTP